MIYNFVMSLLVATIATGASYLAAFHFGWIETVNWLECFAVFTSYSCTYLCVKQSRWNYPIGAISTTALAIFFWQIGLYASAVLNVYLAPVLLYGWWRWGPDKDTRPVTHLDWRWLPVYGSVVGLIYLIVYAINDYFDATLALLDASILVGSIFAQLLLDNKKIETWLVWMAVNVVAIWTYWHADAKIVALQFVFFLANAFWGYYMWRKTQHA